MPRIVLTLLPHLARLGYGALAIEVPADICDSLTLRGLKQGSETPAFFERPGADGRGNTQLLALIEGALSAPEGWRLLCFDVAQFAALPDGPDRWSARDEEMARNLLAQRDQLCPSAKVIGICGNMHSRLLNRAPEGHWMRDCWPSFAAQLQERAPHLAIRSVGIRFASGTFYNMGVKSFYDQPRESPEIRCPENGEHSLELVLPRAIAATFLREP